jgi:hypothetical protein
VAVASKTSWPEKIFTITYEPRGSGIIASR